MVSAHFQMEQKQITLHVFTGGVEASTITMELEDIS